LVISIRILSDVGVAEIYYCCIVTTWSKVFLEKLAGPQIGKKPEGSLHSLEPVTCSYPEPGQSSPCLHPTTERYTLMLFPYLPLGLPSGVFSSGFSTETMYIIILIIIIIIIAIYAP
jgi:hypothetical protein